METVVFLETIALEETNEGDNLKVPFVSSDDDGVALELEPELLRTSIFAVDIFLVNVVVFVVTFALAFWSDISSSSYHEIQ
jgi:hypothetical protein